MLVGGHAVNYYGYIRTTQDMDLLIYPSHPNALRIMAALDEFGFGGAGIPQACFEYIRGIDFARFRIPSRDARRGPSTFSYRSPISSKSNDVAQNHQ